MKTNQPTNNNTAMNTPDLNKLREQVANKTSEKKFNPDNITINNAGAALLLLVNVGLTMYILHLKKKCIKGKGE